MENVRALPYHDNHSKSPSGYAVYYSRFTVMIWEYASYSACCYITAAHLSSKAVMIQSMSTRVELYTVMTMETCTPVLCGIRKCLQSVTITVQSFCFCTQTLSSYPSRGVLCSLGRFRVNHVLSLCLDRQMFLRPQLVPPKVTLSNDQLHIRT